MDEVEVECKPGTYPNLDDIMVEDEGPPLLLPCIICNKTFKPEVLQRHSKVCEKNAHKKRKTFDSFKQRVRGTDLAEFLPYTSLQKRSSLVEKPASPKKASSHWKETHEAFVSAIRAARGEDPDVKSGSGDSRSLLRPPDHEQCPYCERHFGKKAFDRHQEWCREQHSRQPPVIASSQAKERLEARIKYRAPPIKSKRAITREKYSPLVQRKVRHASPSSNSNLSSNNSTTGSATSSAGSIRHTSVSQQEQSNRLSKSGNSLSGRSQSKDASSALGFSRGLVGRTSLRASQRVSQRPSSPTKSSPAQRPSSPTKSSPAQRPSSPTKSSPGGGKVPSSPTQRSCFEEVRTGSHDNDDLAVTSTSLRRLPSKNQTVKQHDSKGLDSQKLKIQKKQTPTLSIPAASSQTLAIEVHSKELKENNNNRTSKNELLWRGSQRDETYDPYASAERQMMELLRSDSACNIVKNQKPKSPSPAPSLSPMPSPTLPLKPSPLETSPTSAFTRYAKELESCNQTQKVVETKNQVQSDPTEVFENSTKEELIEHQKTPEQLQPKASEPVLEISSYPSPPNHPQPPPRSNKRLGSLQHVKTLDDLFVSGISATRPPLEASQSLDEVLEDLNSSNYDFNNRPKTYDVDRHPKKEKEDMSMWFDRNKQCSPREIEFPTILDTVDGRKVEVLNLDNRNDRKSRHETRESREIREITEQESGISDIDNLLEEVVRMQRSVSMLSEAESVHSKNTLPMSSSHSSARTRRNRAGKMHIEDFLFPAELLERDNNNHRIPKDPSDPSSLVFGSTKSRRSSSRGRRLIEDMLFPPGTDLNANSGVNNEDADVVVPANALSVTCPSPGGCNLKSEPLPFPYPSSPVALTSKAPLSNSSDGLPRPKPMSPSTHSSRKNGCNEGNERDAAVHTAGQMQTHNQSRQSTSSRLSADSAYSSLNRRSPVSQVRRQSVAGVQDTQHLGAESPQSILSQSLTQSLALSSSGSESSLPPLSTSQTAKRGGRSKHDCDTPSSDIVSATTPLLPKLSKFCHHCGTKFLITVAKFCHECGAARLEIC